MEAWHDEDGGGDNVAVNVIKHNDPLPTDGTDSLITGDLLGFNAPTAHSISFTLQPTNVTLVSGNTATFTAAGQSDGTISIGTTGLFNPGGDVTGLKAFTQFPNVLLQWYKNGTAIAGATTSSYTTPPLKPSDDKAQYVAEIRALGFPNWSNSSPAIVTVITDTNKPTAYAATFDSQGLPVISVSFSKTMDLAAISKLANYTVSGGGATVYELVADTNDARHVTLKFSAPLTGPVTLTMSGITDYSGNALVTSTLNVATSPLINTDVSDPTAALVVPASWASRAPCIRTVRPLIR